MRRHSFNLHHSTILQIPLIVYLGPCLRQRNTSIIVGFRLTPRTSSVLANEESGVISHAAVSYICKVETNLPFEWLMLHILVRLSPTVTSTASISKLRPYDLKNAPSYVLPKIDLKFYVPGNRLLVHPAIKKVTDN